MKPHVATAVHAYLLILIGLYKFSDTSAPIDILISVIFAVPLLTLNSGVQYGVKPPLYISTFLSLSSIVVLSVSFYKAWLKSDVSGIFTNGLVVLTGTWAFALLISHFINEKKKKRKLSSLNLNNKKT